mmetsp:Transcript_10967/g.25522  ORF Transcript_10967/g.25522 Transcript_10967/m.25522 type:complete len:270 (-) Transcript_10967:1261-2070(-)
MQLKKTRSLVELRIARRYSIEALVQISSTNLTWWNQNHRAHERELYRLIGRFLPKECGDEIRKDRQERAERRKPASEKDIGKLGKKRKAEVFTSKGKEKGGDDKNGNKTKRGKKGTRKKKKKIDKSSPDNDTDSAALEHLPKILRDEGRWVFGEDLQICYKMEDIEPNACTTLVYKKKVAEEEDSRGVADSSKAPSQLSKAPSQLSAETQDVEVPLAVFRRWKKLSKRIVIWLFPFDPDNPTDLSVTKDSGFPLPDMIPFCDIFMPGNE